ncbi:MAG: TetR family transcriptional regulator [Candidatus Acidiferrales bacterium]
MKAERKIREPGRASPRPVSRRERHTAAVRQRLFDAALHLFAERGFTKTTVEDITDAADVGKGTFFNYFPSKEQLLTSFGETRIAKIRAALAEAVEGREAIREVVRRLLFALVHEPGRSPKLARSMILAMLSNEIVRRQACARLAQGHALTSKIFLLGQQRGEVRGDVSAADLASSFKESYFGALLVWSFTPSARLIPTFQRAFAQFWSAAAVPPRRGEKKGKEQ